MGGEEGGDRRMVMGRIYLWLVRGKSPMKFDGWGGQRSSAVLYFVRLSLVSDGLGDIAGEVGGRWLSV